jgi:hypothetical protein
MDMLITLLTSVHPLSFLDLVKTIRFQDQTGNTSAPSFISLSISHALQRQVREASTTAAPIPLSGRLPECYSDTLVLFLLERRRRPKQNLAPNFVQPSFSISHPKINPRSVPTSLSRSPPRPHVPEKPGRALYSSLCSSLSPVDTQNLGGVWFRGYDLGDGDIPNQVVGYSQFSVWLRGFDVVGDSQFFVWLEG